METRSIDYATPTTALLSGLYVNFAMRPEEWGETTQTSRLQTRHQHCAETSSPRAIRPYISRRTVMTTVTRKPNHL